MEKFINILLILTGSISLLLGIIGIFLPLLPTTPFMLLASVCYFKGSKKLYTWLISNKYLGDYIRNYQKHKAINKKSKAISIATLWILNIYSIVFIVNIGIIKLLLIIIVIVVTIFLLKLKTI